MFLILFPNIYLWLDSGYISLAGYWGTDAVAFPGISAERASFQSSWGTSVLVTWPRSCLVSPLHSYQVPSATHRYSAERYLKTLYISSCHQTPLSPPPFPPPHSSISWWVFSINLYCDTVAKCWFSTSPCSSCLPVGIQLKDRAHVRHLFIYYQHVLIDSYCIQNSFWYTHVLDFTSVGPSSWLLWPFNIPSSFLGFFCPSLLSITTRCCRLSSPF